MERIGALATFMGIAVALAIPAAAFGQAGPSWTHIASACVVDEGDLNDYLASYHEIVFKSPATGQIIARCNITSPDDQGHNPLWNRFGVTFKDPDGTGTAARIQAVVYKVHGATGAKTTLATFDSNRFTGTGPQYQGIDFNHSWSFPEHYYFVQITMTRSSSYSDLRLYGVRLDQLDQSSGAAGASDTDR